MKLCLRTKDSLTCAEGGKPCNNKDCAIVKMGYRAENFEDTPTQQKIKDILSGMTDLLLYKNRKYGDSAVNLRRFSTRETAQTLSSFAWTTRLEGLCRTRRKSPV